VIVVYKKFSAEAGIKRILISKLLRDILKVTQLTVQAQTEAKNAPLGSKVLLDVVSLAEMFLCDFTPQCLY